MSQAKSEDEKLSFKTKVSYAVGVLASSVGPGTIVPFWYLFFLTDVAELNPALAGITIIVGGVWDAINNPLMGWISDKTRTSWGRRRPYLLLGAVPYGVLFALMWWVPPIESQLLLCGYFALIYILFDGAVTLVGCPYDALIPELTLDYDERTSLTSYRAFFSIVTGLMAAVGFGIALDWISDLRFAFLGMGATLGLVFIPTILIAFWGTEERREFQERPAASFWESIKYVLDNRPWRYTLGMRIMSWVPLTIAQAVFVYYLVYWIGMREGMASMMQGVILGSSALFLPAVSWIGQYWEKNKTYIVAMLIWLLVMIGILFIPQGAKTLIWIMAALVGPGVAAAHALPRTMSADTLDFDQLQSGRRQEGIYAGIEVFARKISTKVIVAGIGPILAWAGYVEGVAEQTTQTLWAIRLIISVLPAIILVGAIVLAWKYPLSREKHQDVQDQLEEKDLIEQGGS